MGVAAKSKSWVLQSRLLRVMTSQWSTRTGRQRKGFMPHGWGNRPPNKLVFGRGEKALEHHFCPSK